MKPSFNQIKSIQMSQNFSGFDNNTISEIDFNGLITMPNQFMYKVDCRSAEISDTMGSSKALFGYNDINKIEQIYGLIKPNYVENFIKETTFSLDFVKHDPKRVIPKRNIFSSFIEMKVGNGYGSFLRQAFSLRSDKNGIMTHTAGIYTALPKSFQNHTYSPKMYGEDAIFYRNEHLKEFDGFVSNRELEILKLISEGYNSSKISEILFISRHTVDTHRKNIVKKLEAINTPHLVAIGKDIGLI
ncbi:MAG: response regulator transcription factor [Bacteroidota bacterium]